MLKNFFKKDELKLLWPFYFDCLVVSIVYLYPAFFIIYMINIGLSLFQIGLLTSSLSLGAVLFEIPTGFIADKIGPRYAIFLGAFFLIPIIIIYSKIKE